MGRPGEERFREVFDLLERRIEDRYGIPVRISDVPHPFTGDLDGAEIEVDHDQSIEEGLFVLAHLFGHTVQWNTCSRAREIGGEIPARPSEELLRELEEYERQACGYSLELFHQAGVHDLDGWLSDFAHCDLAFLLHLYRTGERRPFRSFFREGGPLIRPIPIPFFRPERWVSRWKGIVIPHEKEIE